MQADKALITRRFSRAAQYYEDQADIQRHVADVLLGEIDGVMQGTPDSVLEVGCCTGLLTKKLLSLFPAMQTLHVNDLSETFKTSIDQVLEGSHTDYLFIAGDMEELTLPVSMQYDLIISSSTFHWFHDLKGFFKRIHPFLKKSGLLAFTIYGPDNLTELREITGKGLDYHSMTKITTMLEENFSLLKSFELQKCYTFKTPIAVLKHLRETGVNSLTKTVWHKSDLIHFANRYSEQFHCEGGVYLTYHPMFFLACPR